MKNKILSIILVVLLGIVFGLMFNTSQETRMLTRKLVAQQGETIDLLRTLVENQNNIQAGLADITTKVNNVDEIMKNIPKPSKRAQRPQEDFKTVHEIPIGGLEFKGKPNAPVTIVGFLDLECPFSKRFQPVINQALEAYPNQVKYVVKHFPLGFHKQAIPAAKALMAAGEQGKYYEMLELILANNRGLNDAKYEEFAKDLRLNVKKFKNALAKNDEAWTKLIQEDLKLGSKVGVRGTPTYYLNGRKTSARTVEALKKEIDVILK